MLVPVHSQSQRHPIGSEDCFSKSVLYQIWFGTEMLVADGSYGDLYDLSAIGVCLVIRLVSEHHKIELHLFFPALMRRNTGLSFSQNASKVQHHLVFKRADLWTAPIRMIRQTSHAWLQPGVMPS